MSYYEKYHKVEYVRPVCRPTVFGFVENDILKTPYVLSKAKLN